jgi:outer membrane protein OmpA-like peptidoglycan-associated protein/tetratricopeptide (TPR) repeat protein
MVKPTRFTTLLFPFRYIHLPVFLLLVSIACQSPRIVEKYSENQFVKAQKAISSGNYTEAEEIILKAIKKDSINIKAYLLLSDISDELKKREQQKHALEKVVHLDSVNYPLAFKLLAGLYFSDGDYSISLTNYLHYKRFKKTSDSSFVSTRILSCEFAQSSISKNNTVTILSPGEGINSSLQEYWPAIATNDSLLYFTRLIINDKNFPYERIFQSERNKEGWSKAEELLINDDENVNIGTMCISADGQLLFYTACGQKDGYGSCDIYYSRKRDGIWSKPKNAGPVLNTSAWEAQPSVSSDNNYLYFASNRKGGFGGMDIWRCEMKEMSDGSLFFSNPENPGRSINTREDDFSPFIHADGSTLYFSSEGRYGFGGSDIYISRLKDRVWSEAVNLGYPINSRFDDDGLVVSPTAKVAFFSSNREGTTGASKDLFQLELPKEFLPEKVGYLTGKVFDSKTGKSLEAIIEITQIGTENTKRVTSDISEGYITTLTDGLLYSMHVEKDGYLLYSRQFNLKNPSDFQQAERLSIYLEPVEVGKHFILPNVFFDFDSAVLKPESFDELQKLVKFMRDNSHLTIEISGHTDNVGTDAYNITLSINRALSIYNYLIQYVDSTRLSYKGFGSQFPISTNDTEQGRAVNRRCEAKITGD